MQITYTIEPHKTAASLLEDKEYSIGLWANAMRDNRLHELPAFLAWCELTSFGPKNDWNGQRSAALRLYNEIQTEIVVPACAIRRAAHPELTKGF